MGSPPSRRPKAGGKGKVSEHDDDAWRKEGGEGGREGREGREGGPSGHFLILTFSSPSYA